VSASVTPTLPPRAPDGWWMAHKRYRMFMLFALASGVLSLVSIVLLMGVRALAHGVDAWTAYLAILGSPLGLGVSAALLVPTCFFSLRWLRVGVKVPQVALGPLPAPGAGVLYVLHYAGLATVTLLVFLLLSGVVL